MYAGYACLSMCVRDCVLCCHVCARVLERLVMEAYLLGVRRALAQAPPVGAAGSALRRADRVTFSIHCSSSLTQYVRELGLTVTWVPFSPTLVSPESQRSQSASKSIIFSPAWS